MDEVINYHAEETEVLLTMEDKMLFYALHFIVQHFKVYHCYKYVNILYRIRYFLKEIC